MAAQKFLTHFAHIPIPNSSHVISNHLVFGIMLPSCISPIALTGCVMNNVKFHTNNKIFSSYCISDLPDEHKNEFIKKAITRLKMDQDDNRSESLVAFAMKSSREQDQLLKLKTLVEFCEQLNILNEYAESSKCDSGKRTDIQKDVAKLYDIATAYISDDRIVAFSSFKN